MQSTRGRNSRHPGRRAGVWLGLTMPAFLLACTGTVAPPAPAGEQADAVTTQMQKAKAGDPADYYTVRAQVMGLPDPADEVPRIVLHHEAINDLKGVDGTIWGMDSMTMPFFLAAGVDLAGLSEGDIVEFTLKVDWKAETPQEVTSVKRLPPGTALVFPGGANPS